VEGLDTSYYFLTSARDIGYARILDKLVRIRLLVLPKFRGHVAPLRGLQVSE